MHGVRTLIVALLLINLARAADACQCGKVGTAEEEAAGSRAVFVGRVVEVTDQFTAVKQLSFWLRTKYARITAQYSEPAWERRSFGYAITFEVRERIHGNIGTRVTYVTGRSAYEGRGGDCGIGLYAGNDYLVYVNSYDPDWVDLDSCGRTKPLSQAREDLAALRRLKSRT